MAELKNNPRIVRAMREHGLDGLLASSPENVFYASGWLATMGHTVIGRFPAFVLLTPDNLTKPTLIVPGADLGFVFDNPGYAQTEIRPFGDFFLTRPEQGIELSPMARAIDETLSSGTVIKDRVQALVQEIRDAGLETAKIGIDEVGLPEELLQALAGALPRAHFERAHTTFNWIRSVKTQEEEQRLHKALRITENAIRETLEVVRIGVTENELAKTLELSMVSQGARPLFTMISFGSRSATGLWTSDTCLARDDMLKYDVGCVYQGYKSDTAFMASLGKPTERALNCFEAVRSGAERVAELLRPGVRPNALLAEGVRAVRRAGLPSFGRQHAGHGIGLGLYDEPLLTTVNETPIEEGMVLNIELPYYEIGLGGFNVEDTMVVTADGARHLKSLPREIAILG